MFAVLNPTGTIAPSYMFLSAVLFRAPIRLNRAAVLPLESGGVFSEPLVNGLQPNTT